MTITTLDQMIDKATGFDKANAVEQIKTMLKDDKYCITLDLRGEDWINDPMKTTQGYNNMLETNTKANGLITFLKENEILSQVESSRKVKAGNITVYLTTLKNKKGYIISKNQIRCKVEYELINILTKNTINDAIAKIKKYNGIQRFNISTTTDPHKFEQLATQNLDNDPCYPKSRGRCFDIGISGGCGAMCAAMHDGECEAIATVIEGHKLKENLTEDEFMDILKVYDLDTKDYE